MLRGALKSPVSTSFIVVKFMWERHDATLLSQLHYEITLL